MTNPSFSRETFDLAFSQGMHNLLADTPSPSELVLAAANGIYLDDPTLHAATEQQCSRFVDSLKKEQAVQGQDGGMLQSVIELGLIGDTNAVHERQVGEWNLYYNAFRSLRPPGEARGVISDIEKPFTASGFNFNRVTRESFWRHQIDGVDAWTYYNKFPFSAKHAVLVPDPQKELPQYLQKRYHDFAWDFMSAAAPGTVVGYNSLGAFASINHLHFQLVVGDTRLPIEDKLKAGTVYPAPRLAFDTPEEAWQCIQELHATNQPYNLIYLPGNIIVFPRRFQGTYAQPDWTTGFAWFELGGNFVAKKSSDFHSITDLAIQNAFEGMFAPLSQVA